MDYNDDNQRNHNEEDLPVNPPAETEQASVSQTEKGPGLTKPVKPNNNINQPKRKNAHPVLSGMAGGIISAVIVAALFLMNIIPVPSANNAGSTAPADTPDAKPAIADTIASDDASVASDINEVSKAVVGILNMQQQNVWTPNKEAASGSGIIYKKKDGKAYIVTNNHVVEGASEVEVVLDNDEHVKAKVLGTDKLTDLAVMQIDGSKVDTVAKLGSSNSLKVGETVIAIGNPLGMTFSGSVTKGIISGLHRSIDVDTNGDNQPDWISEVIQTDAAINPGNSGGALVNKNGEVIGINSMKVAKAAVEGIGLAIPIDSARPIMKQLATKGEVARPFIGISTATLEQVPMQYRQNIQLPENVKHGMVVANVEDGSPASAAGLQQFDVITKINNEKLESLIDLRSYMYSKTKIGDTVKLEIYRNGKKQTVSLKLAERKS